MFRSVRLPQLGTWPRLLLAGVCLLLAVGSTLGAKHTGARPAATTAVVVAARDLPAGHLLGHHDVRVARWPVGIRPAGARADPGSVVETRLAGPIRAGEAITPTRLLGPDLAAGLARGLAAATVAVADPHAADLIRAGDHVDVLEAGRPPELAEPAGATAAPAPVRAVAREVVVLAVLPATDAAVAELVVAVDRPTALRLTRDGATHVFTAVVVPP
jgi:Flp pilus assembly protein CpaB